MKMLVIVEQQHQDHYYGRSKHNGFRSSPSRVYRRVVNCRSFESGSIFFSSPFSKTCSFSSFQEPKSPLCHSEPPRCRKFSSPFAIKSKLFSSSKDANFTGCFARSELWAGPAYSNSPPPSCLPIPKFSLRQKRTVSLELHPSQSFIVLQSLSKSAPPSPTREPQRHGTVSFHDNASATENLRRILQLDIIDD